MRTLKEIMATISCNGMREWTDERVAQAMKEYAKKEAISFLNFSQMKKEFVPFEIAVELKELGFDEFCFGEYKVRGESLDINSDMFLKNNILTEGYISAPLWQQAFRFFREKNSLHSSITITFPVYDKINCYSYEIYDINKDYMYRCNIDYSTHEEAELACLKKMIEIAKSK